MTTDASFFYVLLKSLHLTSLARWEFGERKSSRLQAASAIIYTGEACHEEYYSSNEDLTVLCYVFGPVCTATVMPLLRNYIIIIIITINC